MSLGTGLFFLVLLLNQRWSPPLTLQASHCSTFRIMCDVPSIAVFCCESIECFPDTVSKFFLKLLVTIPVAPIVTGTMVYFRFHIRYYSYYYCYYYYYYYYYTIWMSLVTGLFFPVLLLNQRWSPPLTLQASHCSTFRIMCDVPSIAVLCSESIECFPGTASKFFFKLLITIPVAPIIPGTILLPLPLPLSLYLYP